MKLQFIGGAGTVTGSKHLLDVSGHRVLIDCGLFQGVKALRLRNRQGLPFDLNGLDAVVLTHAHIDHTGYLPLLYKQGYRGPVYCTAATAALCAILLPDAGYLQEEEARYANRRGYSKHHPALPLYTREDAEASLGLLRPQAMGSCVGVADGVNVCFNPVGHILGAASVRIEGEGRSVTFSGDVGRPHDPVMYPPRSLQPTDYLVVEATYGDRLHAAEDPADALADAVQACCGRDGVLLIPAFAVGRAQTLLHLLVDLQRQGRIPAVPIFLNSPMAVSATRIFSRFHEEHRLSEAECAAIDEAVTYVNTVEDSKALNARRGPMIVVSASGMLTGGRVLHHLAAFGGDPRNMLLLTGYQAPGTRGEAIASGADTVKMFGNLYPLRAEVRTISSLSAHADYQDMMAWLQGLGTPPRKVFVVHGESHALAAQAARLKSEFGWAAEVPYAEQVVDL